MITTKKPEARHKIGLRFFLQTSRHRCKQNHPIAITDSQASQAKKRKRPPTNLSHIQNLNHHHSMDQEWRQISGE